MLSLLKLLLPLPLVVTIAASQPPQQPPHRVMPIGELYLFAISRAEDDHGVLAPQLKSGAQGVETIVNAFCGDLTVVLTHGESPTIYHRAS